MNKAVFSLEKYQFVKININLGNKISRDLNISLNPSGKFIGKDAVFELKFVFMAYNENPASPVVEIECEALFKFEDDVTIDTIPNYFYQNSIAILFPYIRAFISTVTLQANILPPIILPTMNLSSLEKQLKENTIQL